MLRFSISICICLVLFVVIAAPILFPVSYEISAESDLNEKGAHDDPSGYMKWFYSQRNSHDSINHAPYAKAAQQALVHPKHLFSALINTPSSVWQSVGPSYITSMDFGAVSGRISAIAFDPAHSGTVYVGAAQGGIWKTTDRGTTWTAMTDNQPSLAIGSIAIDSSGTIYVGTGEGNNSCDSYYGAGILKSTDGGQTWVQLGASTFNSATITQLAINYSNPNIILATVGTGFSSSSTAACTFSNPGINYGVYKSTDGGNNWSLVLNSNNNNLSDMVIDPSNSQIVYAATSGVGIFKSTDGGITWNLLPSPTTPNSSIDRIALGISSKPVNTLYAAINVNDSGLVFKSVTGGSSWSTVTTPKDAFGTSFCDGQCWYDIYVAPDPTNANIVYVGGLDLYRSTNGGTSWNDLGGYSGFIHPDQHAFAFDPTSHTNVFVGNDGGVWSSSTVSTCTPSSCWKDLNKGLVITQFQSLAAASDNANLFFGGTQDNGSPEHSSTSTVWSELIGGDGGWSGFDPSNTPTIYHTFFGISPQRSDNGGITWTDITSGIDQNDPASFYIPMTIDKQHPSTLYLGTSNLYKTVDKGASWTLSNLSVDTILSAIAVAPSNDQYVYAGTADGKFYTSTNGGQNFVESDTGLPINFITKIAVDPSNPQQVYATFSGFGGHHAFFSPDNGTSWSDITYNLPDVPANAILVNGGQIFVGTDIGPYVSKIGDSNWSKLGTGFPTVTVFDLVLSSDGKLLAATHGRGVWSIATTIPDFSLSASPSALTVQKGQSGNSTVKITHLNGFNSTVGLSLSGTPTGVTGSFLNNQIIVVITRGAGGSADAACVSTNNCFTPNPVKVTPGETVIWKNTDAISHTVTSGKADNSTGNIVASIFDSGLLSPGNTFSHTFTTANVGTINYFCQVHPWMTGQVIVGNTANSILTVSVDKSVTSGTYPLTITGVNGSLTHTTTITLKVPANTTTSITSSLNPSKSGQSVTITSKVSPVAPSTGTPTGTMIFAVNDTSLSPVTLTSGKASVSISMGAGINHITATYFGDSNFAPNTSKILNQTVNKASTTTIVSANSTTIVYGQPVTFSSKISPVAPSTGIPTGNVLFTIDGIVQPQVTLSAGKASLPSTTLTIGTHKITAQYVGNSNFTSSTSSTLNQAVSKASTKTSLTSNQNPSIFGQQVNFTATVSPSAATGTVTFTIDGVAKPAVTLAGSQAVFSISTLSVGSHTVTTKYSGDANFVSSTSTILTQKVNKNNTSTSVTSSINPSDIGQQVNFTATVSPITATGTVTFTLDGTSKPLVTVVGGQASFTLSSLSVGSHNITAKYSGDANFAPSTSNMIQTVNQPLPSLSLIMVPNQLLFACHGTTGGSNVNNQMLMANGGSPFPGYTWTVSSGQTLPSGIKISPNGVLQSSGGALVPNGSYPFNMDVTDGITTATGTFTLEVFSDETCNDINNGMSQSPYTLPDATTSKGYGASLAVEGGMPLYHWSVASGQLPPGLSLDSIRGVVYGVPFSSDAGNTYTFTVKITDSQNRVAQIIGPPNYSITVSS